MKLTREQMLSTLGTRDPSNNGKFIIGVLSTGIYCLPSCHARTPKAVNVKFFANGREARDFGLRACKKCRPDMWEAGIDREADELEDLANRVRREPGRYGQVSDIAKSLKIGNSRLSDRFRTNYQCSPGEFLLSARFFWTLDKLENSCHQIGAIAVEAGFESLSAFNEGFKRRFGLTPSQYRELRAAKSFQFELPTDYDLNSFKKSFFRDPQSPTERDLGDRAVLATPNGSLVDFKLGPQITVRIKPGTGFDAFKTLYRVLGLNQSPRQFEKLVLEKGLGRLVDGRLGARIPQTYSVFDGLIWAVLGQQINLPFTYKLRQRLFQIAGTEVAEGLYAIPEPGAVANLSLEQLSDLQLSRRKSEYLLGIARLGNQDIEQISDLSFTNAKRKLLGIRGLGEWSVNYILMRSLGFPDCLPLGDTGLTAGVAKFHALELKPDSSKVEQFMLPFSPHRSLATYHLWQSL